LFGFLRRRIVGAAIGKGVFGESRFWLVVAIGMGVRFVVRKLAGEGPELLFSEELGPSDRLLIGAARDTE
jgi:hypothetical protein